MLVRRLLKFALLIQALQGNLVMRESKGRLQATTTYCRKNALGKQWREARCFLFSAAFPSLPSHAVIDA
jgi:hypothetical protein